MIRKLLLLIFSKKYRELRQKIIILERDNELFRRRELALHAELKNWRVKGGGC